ncbi:MAG: response regulator transcription factor [Tissierellia bacterium]|nr:response regulator transcription factor [Tissierellia bacterium]
MNKILIVEDDLDINNLLRDILTAEGYQVTQAYTGADGLQRLEENFDLILLDLMMPIIDGETMILKMREDGYTEPIIVLSAKIDTETRYRILDIGADDFISKPFDRLDVLYRIKANIRRYRDFAQQKNQKDVITFKKMVYDREDNRILLNNIELKLTPIEMEILKTLLENPNKIFTKENLYRSAWKEDYFYEADTINVHISNLRNKLKKIDPEDYIETIWGMGYRLKK